MKLNSIVISFFLLWVTGIMIYVLPVSKDNPNSIRDSVESILSNKN
jgi:hypothetical protein